MKNHKINIRVRYAETDKMGYVYYGNYAQYFEIGRVEWLRNLGISYKEMEDNGIMLPVTHLDITYRNPAKYDDLLCLETCLVKIPGVRINFSYHLVNQKQETIVIGNTTLVFVDMKKNKPQRAPEFILEKIIDFF